MKSPGSSDSDQGPVEFPAARRTAGVLPVRTRGLKPARQRPAYAFFAFFGAFTACFATASKFDWVTSANCLATFDRLS